MIIPGITVTVISDLNTSLGQINIRTNELSVSGIYAVEMAKVCKIRVERRVSTLHCPPGTLGGWTRSPREACTTLILLL